MKLWIDLDEIRDSLKEATSVDVYEYRTPKGLIKAPYIIVAEVNDSNVWADDSVYVKGVYISVNLLVYQGQDSRNSKRSTVEEAIERFFVENGIPFSKDTDWYSDIQLFQTEYTARFFYGEKD